MNNHGLPSSVLRPGRRGFSLFEVVLALGVISFAIVAILGVLPTGLQTNKSSQDETRATQIAQTVLSSVASQAPTQFNNVRVQLDDDSTVTFNLTSSDPPPAFFADNNGRIMTAGVGATYKITVTLNSSPTGFDPGSGNQVSVRVSWPANAPTGAQTSRDYVRIISKF